MDTGNIKSIVDLQGYNFVIPSYQRCYRWSKNEVLTLLDDIWDYMQEHSEEPIIDNFYCLQPIIVKNDNEIYNVIDGQQRLTTILLIIRFLLNTSYFSIIHQTRDVEYMLLLDNVEHNTDSGARSIDYYYIIEAYKSIKEFFKNVDDTNKQKFTNILLNNCKVLWYEIQDNENDAFIRLNIGKIPLLPAENIKALFLANNNNVELEELKERAEFWYSTELKARENNDFIYCVLNKIDSKDIIPENRTLNDDIQRIEPYLRAIFSDCSDGLFEYFYQSYKDKTINDKWEKLENSVNTLQSFASNSQNDKVNKEIFHYIGFLTLSGMGIHKIYEMWQKEFNIYKFRDLLFETICNKISNAIINIDKLLYGKYNEYIHDILLIFNLEYLISQEDSNNLFQFNKFQLQEWNLDHICHHSSRSISRDIQDGNLSKIKEWAMEINQYIFDNDELRNNIELFILSKKQYSDRELNKLIKNIDEYFKENIEFDKIQNITLLDKKQRSMIGNLIFSQKRKKIYDLKKNDKLIPIATEKVFEKAFSSHNDNPDIFTQRDMEDYLNTIKKYLSKYTQGE